MNKITIECIDNITVDLKNLPIKNPHALNFMPHGLFRLALIIKIEEGKKTPPNPNVKVFEIFAKMDPIIPCTFHWFSTSMVNFVRLVGLIKTLNTNSWTTLDIVNNKNKIKTECNSYVESVIPELKKWRNKVSAHFAPTDPYDNDNFGTLEQSVMNNVCFQQNRFCVNAATLTSHGETSVLPRWSVTETYENLISRYWPKSRLDFDIKKCIGPDWHDFIPKT
jgi:hypothetical protein